MTEGIKKTLVLVLLLLCALLCFGGPPLLRGQAPTTKNTPLSRWRSREYPGLRYVGSRTCAQCHTTEARQLETPMAHALEASAECGILRGRERLSFREGPYTYEITREGKQSTLTVGDGRRTMAETILYCFGQGEVGQTYVFQHGGKFYESRVSYFRKLQGLGFTIGHPQRVPASVDEALGRPISRDEAQSCFGCHATAAVSESRLQLDSLTPGVSCEACHGPGEKHVAAVRARNTKDLQIFNPGNLSANELSQEFCGSCHLSYDQAMLLPGQGGINNIRFQAYRIFNSPGHNGSDRRISCVGCHDPHEKLEHEASFYDAKCLACHLSVPQEVKTKLRAASACPVSTKQCVTCHMPKVEVPGMHAGFTDHWIRVSKPDEPVPN